MGKRKETGIVLPRMTVLSPMVVNVSNPPENVATEGVDECFNLDLAEDLQNEIVPDSVLKAGILRGKLNKIEKDRK